MHCRDVCICLATLLLPFPAAADCLKANAEGQVAQGQLTIGRAHDAAGRIERPYILHLATDACLDSDDPDEAVKSTRTIHVFPDNDKLVPVFRRLVGKTVIVHGSPFPAITAHHPRANRDGGHRDKRASINT